MCTYPLRRLLASIGIAVSVVAAGLMAPDVASGGGAVSASASAVAPCTVPAINVRKGRLEGAAGSRFQTLHARNDSSMPCATPGWTRYRFVDASGPIGFRSAPNRGFDSAKPPLVIPADDRATSVLSWVDPGVVPKHRCHPRAATGVTVHISGLLGRYTVRLHAEVCTTKKFRPNGTRLKVR